MVGVSVLRILLLKAIHLNIQAFRVMKFGESFLSPSAGLCIPRIVDLKYRTPLFFLQEEW